MTAGGGATVTGINATLQITGTISGTVKDSTSAPISGVCVDAYSAGTYVDGTSTLSDGTYSIPGLTPGTYTVDFTADCGTTTSYLEQWYNGASTASSATPVVLASGGTAAAINATMSTGGSISGTVKDSTSAPISGISADAYDGYSYVGSAVTQSNGTYTITGLAAGSYTVEFYGCGTTGSYVLQWYQGAAGQSTATSVAVANNQAVTGINATMQGAGTISGTVTNQPATGSIVSVYQGGTYVTEVEPLAAGTYSITGLMPGSYTVEFSASGSVTQWYNGVSTEAAATPLTVGAGQTVSGINATLQNDGQISGTVTDVSSDPVNGACVYVYQAGTFVTSTTSGVGGTYDATVPPGAYTVEFASGCGNGTNLASQWYNGAQSEASATPVTVTAGQTSTGINGQLLPFGSITGTARSVSGTPLPDICVLAQPVSSGTPGYYDTTTAADGTYSLTDVPAGSYYVEFEWCGYTTQGYLTQYYGDSPTAQASTPVVVTPGAATPSINASMLTGGSVSGTVTTGTTPLPDVCVYVFNGSTLVTSAYTGDDGTYTTYEQLAPGQYQVEFDPTCSAYGTGGAQSLVPQWYGGSATQSASTPITVTNGQTTTSVNAQLAVQAGDGVIAGTVTNALGTGSSGVCVDAYPLGQGPPAKPVATGVTGSNGAYALTDTTNGTTSAALPAGSYQVAFDPTCGGSFANGFLEQWYNGATSESGATTVVVASASTVGNINDVLQSGSTAPVISSVTPAGGPVGGGTAVTINGFNLSGATVTVGGSALTITSDTATSITGTTPAGASGAADVVVHTANGSATDFGGFTYAPVPTVTGISPNSGSTAGGTAVTITGTNLANATAVTVGGNPLVVATDAATSITGTTPAGTSGPAAVAVTTFGGTATDAGAFTYVTSPTITGVAPAAGPTAGGTPIVISGANLAGATSVTVGGITVVPTSDTATSIQVTTPLHAAGSVDVVVTTALGTATDTGGYTYQAAPTVSGIVPTSGPASGGTAVAITGTNLVGVTGVSFGSTAAASFTVNSSTSVTATSPSGGSGTVDITVTTPGGTSAPGTPDKFTFIPAPVVSGVTPSSGPAAGGTTVTVSGTNFTGATAVKFGTTTVLPQSVTATSLTAVSPGGSGKVDVTVTTPGGTSATVLADEFNYLTAPVITSAAPPTSTVTGTAYGFTFTASGNPAPTFALATGAPAWLSINSTTGVLSGTVPAGITTFTYSVVASNGVTPTATAGPFTVAVSSPPTFTTDSPPTTSVTGQSYSYTFVASGNPAPTFALATGAPVWLSINSTSGALSGTVPAGITTFTYSVVASNGTAPNATAGPFTVSATTPPAFTTDSPPTTSVTGHAYSYTFAASGNPAPTFALATGAPVWLSVNTTTGAVSGTVPAGITTFTYSLVASNGTAPSATAGPFVVAVSSPPAFTSASPPTVETAGQSYGYTFAASGNPAPTFALATGAPAWLSINPTSGALSGTVPAGTTTFTYSVVAANGVTPNATAGPFVVAVSSPPLFTTDSPPTTSVTGHAYSYTFAASGNPAPTFALATGAPAWLSVNATTGAVSGTVPAGITTFTYSVVASNGITPSATAGPFVVAVSTPPAFTTDSPPMSGTAGQSYSYTFAASGNPAPTFALATGAPAWLSINPTSGALSGTVPAGTTTFTYSVVAANGTAPNATAGPFTVNVPEAPLFTTDSPPTTSVTGHAYNYTFAASGNPAPTFALATGAPVWLSVNATTGAVSGTVPAGITTFTYSVVASNGITPSATAGPFVVAVSTPPAFTTDSPPLSGTAGQSYSYTFAASGNPAPTFALATGAPAWLSINPTSGALSGTVPAGTTTFTYSVVAANGTAPNATAGPFTVNVPEAPLFTTDSPPTTSVTGHAYSYTFAASGNPAPTFALATGAPVWLSVNATTGAVSGTVPAGITTFTYSVVASNGITPSATAGPFVVAAYTLPDAPTGVTATAGVGSAQVSWTEPSGGGAASSFTIASNPATSTTSVGGAATTATVSGLQPGVSYTFTVTAVNAGGPSASSAASNAVVPTAVAPQGSTSGSGTNPTASTASGSTTVTAAATGSGTVTVATYPSDPVAAFSTGTAYFDVSAGPGADFTALSFQVCGLDSGQSVSWWDPAAQAWEAVSDVTPVDASGCATVSLSASTSPSIGQLTGTVFAATLATGHGYWLVASDGGIFAYGDAGFYGSTGAMTLNKPIVGMAPTPSGHGYWLVASDGGIFAYGDAGFYGSTGAMTLNKPIVGMAATPSGHGYWLVASDGGIFAYGDAGFYGSTGAMTLNKPIVGMAPTPSGHGYWLVASDGGIFAYGDAGFYGSTGAMTLNKPIVGMAPTPSGHGYWLVASDGGIFAYGDAGFYGSTGAMTLNKPIVGMAPTPSGHGYWLVASDGGIFAYGDAGFYGSTGAMTLNKPIVGMAT